MKRTALVTAASIAAVVITGTAAVGANIGILSSADDSPVGELGATTEVAAPIDLVVEVPTSEPSPGPDAAAQPSPQPRAVAEDPPNPEVRTEVFQVDQAGTVVVTVDGRTVQVASVEPAAGWSWTPDDDVPDDSLDVRFRSGSEVLVLHVEVRSDGTLDARIDRPQPPAASRPTVAPAAPVYEDDDRYEDDDHDDDRYEDDDHDDDRYEVEHEGRDDDD